MTLKQDMKVYYETFPESLKYCDWCGKSFRTVAALRARVAELEAAAGTLLDLTMRKDEPLNSDHNTMVAMAGDTIRVNEAALWQLQMLLPPEKCGVPSAGGG